MEGSQELPLEGVKEVNSVEESGTETEAVFEHVASSVKTEAEPVSVNQAIIAATKKRARSEEGGVEAVGKDDDDDVILERENSAWDAIGERFRRAAAAGRYLDLSDTTGGEGKELGASEAAQAFSKVDQPVDPSTILQRQADSIKENEEDTPLLEQLGNLVSELVAKLKGARESLLNFRESAPTKASRHDLVMSIKGINRLSRNLQKFVNRNGNATLESKVAVRRIEAMNLLVCKANALISTYNQNPNSSGIKRETRSARAARAGTMRQAPAANTTRPNTKNKRKRQKNAKTNAKPKEQRTPEIVVIE